jgi:hypothetical protein
MVVLKDKFGRKWKGHNIVWIRSINCSREALYRWVVRNGESHLIYDKKRGMCDYRGFDVRESKFKLVPALEGKEGKEWVDFPNTKEANDFKKTLTYNGYAETSNDVIVSNFDENENCCDDFDDEYDPSYYYGNCNEEIIHN